MRAVPLHLCSLGFLSFLALAHLGGDAAVLAEPLSMLRDGVFSSLGYGAFLCLIGAALCHSWKLLASGWAVEGRFALAAAFILAVVAITPTSHPLHEGLAFLLLGMLYAYFGLLLYRARSPLALGHWLSPLWLLCLIGCHSFGLWQKALIVYFVVASNVEALVAAVAKSRQRRARRRRKVWVLDEGRAWIRAKNLHAASCSSDRIA